MYNVIVIFLFAKENDAKVIFLILLLLLLLTIFSILYMNRVEIIQERGTYIDIFYNYITFMFDYIWTFFYREDDNVDMYYV